MELRAVLWGQLPSEILERVLPFVQAPDLCGFRCVCKRWNQLISSREFVALYVRNARRDAPFLMLQHTRKADNLVEELNQGWCLLDLNTRRWFAVGHSDAHARALEANRRMKFARIVAMDGGLVVCQSRSSLYKSHAVLLYNPIAKTLKTLPSAPGHWIRHRTPIQLRNLVNLVVDKIGQTFRTFIVNENTDLVFLRGAFITPDERLRIVNDPLVGMYDSATNEWKGSTNPPCMSGIVPYSSVMFQGFLYVLFNVAQRFPVDWQLWRYNVPEDVWECVYLDPSKPLFYGRLIVSANRLFLVSHDAITPQQSDFQICEASIHDMTLATLFSCSREQATAELFDEREEGYSMGTDVIGFGNSPMFISKAKSGKLIVFDVVTRTWDREWPPTPVNQLEYEYCTWMGRQMNFLLPGAPWEQVP